MEFQSTQGLAAADQSECSVGTRSYVGKLRRAVPSNAVTPKEVDASVQFLVQERHPGVDAQAAADAAIVKCTGSRRSRRTIGWAGSGHGGCQTRINAITERPQNVIHFVVAPSRIGRGLEHEVRPLVECVTRRVKRVKQST